MLNERAVKLLQKVVKEIFSEVLYEKVYFDENEFYYEVKLSDKISENDFKIFEEKMKSLDKNLFIKLLKVSGVYLDSDASKEMIDRIIGKAFNSEEELNDYLKSLEEAKEHDHRKLGQDLDLFCFSDYVGPGLPLYTPRGTIVKDELQKEIERISRKFGFLKVSCPALADISLFETSGHAKKFNDELFRVSSPKNHEFVLKPVQCPHHTQLYASRPRSYKDLPIRYMESDKQYRAEFPGAVGNSLSRVYAITVEDGHVFCSKEQVKDEIINICNLIKNFYSSMGLYNNFWVSLSLRDYSHPEKYIGEPDDWDYCEKLLEEICLELGLNAKKCEGEAALYGPKIDFMFKDDLGREIQIPTVQLDFATPKRFELSYIDENGNKKIPVMVHRAVLGSYERFLVLLLEKYKGALPLWLSPVQVNIIPVNMKYHDEYAKKVVSILQQEDIRVNYDDSNEHMNKKLRNSNLLKNPLNVILGDKERDDKLISFKLRGSDDTISMKLDEFVAYVKNAIKER